MNLHEVTLEVTLKAFSAQPEAETEIPLKVARPRTPLQWFEVSDSCTANSLSRLLVVSDILHNTTSSRQAAWTCPVWKAYRLTCTSQVQSGHSGIKSAFNSNAVCTPIVLKKTGTAESLKSPFLTFSSNSKLDTWLRD